MSVLIEIVNLYGVWIWMGNIQQCVLVLRMKKKYVKVFNFCMMKKYKDINFVVIY